MNDHCFLTNHSFSTFSFPLTPRLKNITNIYNATFSLLPASTQSRANLLLSSSLPQITYPVSSRTLLLSHSFPRCMVFLVVALINLTLTTGMYAPGVFLSSGHGPEETDMSEEHNAGSRAVLGSLNLVMQATGGLTEESYV